jgi:glycogen debranching enzyme
LGTKRAVEEALSSPRFFLPEINAQWIAALEGLVAVAGMLEEAGRGVAASAAPGDLRTLLERARSHFHGVFWNASEGFLHNVVEESLEVRDTIECEAAVTAAALLGETVFSRAELEAVWRRAEKRLLVRRRLGRDGGTPAVFGLLCKAEDQRIYYGDEQYHADVMWPRSTPYLIRLLELLGRRDLVREILLTNLDHQMCEGAIFYNQELFSRPCGNNPAPCEATRHDPVPVKNPIQFWSQWCDPYLDWLEADGGGHDAR